MCSPTLAVLCSTCSPCPLLCSSMGVALLLMHYGTPTGTFAYQKNQAFGWTWAGPLQIWAAVVIKGQCCFLVLLPPPGMLGAMCQVRKASQRKKRPCPGENPHLVSNTITLLMYLIWALAHQAYLAGLALLTTRRPGHTAKAGLRPSSQWETPRL